MDPKETNEQNETEVQDENVYDFGAGEGSSTAENKQPEGQQPESSTTEEKPNDKTVPFEAPKVEDKPLTNSELTAALREALQGREAPQAAQTKQPDLTPEQREMLKASLGL